MWREVKAIELSLDNFAKVLQHSAVTFFTDNQNAVSIIKKGSKLPHLQGLALSIFNTCVSCNISLYAQWIPREENEKADALSRIIDIDDWGISFEFFDFFNSIWGPFTVDRFANMHNTKLTRFNSKYWNPTTSAIDAFTCNWHGENNWLFPPIRLVSNCINHLVYCGAEESKTQTEHIHSTTDTILIKSNENEGTSKTGLFLLGLSKREVIVYSVGIGGCSIGILVCILCVRRYKSTYGGQTVGTIEPLPNNSIMMNEIPVDRIENLYETIDESNMALEINSTGHQSEQNHSSGSELYQTNSTSSKSSDSDDITSMGNNSYLNPYQPIVSDTDPHVYISTYKQPEEVPNTSSEEDDSISNHQNSFQELFKDPEQNEDCNTEKGSKRSSDSSTSTGVTDKSAYINPYYSLQKTPEELSLKYM
ncbi:unnamed protein product [Mytilus coruscus]|uniref:RNase H type-1 domain-containing protein n=1 Tax=Mytilus coruscus TaxID=42192 RepID=A0A6J8CTK0_MYTCO|nr:unnamed protein product [Mytilus coruscus]